MPKKKTLLTLGISLVVLISLILIGLIIYFGFIKEAGIGTGGWLSITTSLLEETDASTTYKLSFSSMGYPRGCDTDINWDFDFLVDSCSGGVGGCPEAQPLFIEGLQQSAYFIAEGVTVGGFNGYGFPCSEIEYSTNAFVPENYQGTCKIVAQRAETCFNCYRMGRPDCDYYCDGEETNDINVLRAKLDDCRLTGRLKSIDVSNLECSTNEDCQEGEICVVHSKYNIMCEPPELCTVDTDCNLYPNEFCSDSICRKRMSISLSGITTGSVTVEFLKEGIECTSTQTTNCEPGDVCINNECVFTGEEPECETNDDCMEGETCVNGECIVGGVEPECETNDDCVGGYICVNNICIEEEPECTTDSDCPQGEVCVNEECVITTEECETNEDCEEGEVCVDGLCITEEVGDGEGEDGDEGVECTTNADCGFNEECKNNVCIKEPTEPGISLVTIFIIIIASLILLIGIIFIIMKLRKKK